jgi:uncharacterized protein YggL (DUF469 family)
LTREDGCEDEAIDEAMDEAIDEAIDEAMDEAAAGALTVDGGRASPIEDCLHPNIPFTMSFTPL